MMNETDAANMLAAEEHEKEIKHRIQQRVLHLERVNYSNKPDGFKDPEMVSKIKKIIEEEVGK